MKRLLLLLLLLLAWPSTAKATDIGYNKRFGLGLMLGDPTGITGKYWTSSRNALDFGLGFYGYGCRAWDDSRYNGCRSHDTFSLHLDYLWETALTDRRSAVELDFHIGFGARALFYGYYHNDPYYGHDTDLALRMPLGLDLMFANPDFLELYVEIAPSLWLFYDRYLGFDFDIGIRFYF